jgi:hypothetical protein
MLYQLDCSRGRRLVVVLSISTRGDGGVFFGSLDILMPKHFTYLLDLIHGCFGVSVNSGTGYSQAVKYCSQGDGIGVRCLVIEKALALKGGQRSSTWTLMPRKIAVRRGFLWEAREGRIARATERENRLPFPIPSPIRHFSRSPTTIHQ